MIRLLLLLFFTLTSFEMYCQDAMSNSFVASIPESNIRSIDGIANSEYEDFSIEKNASLSKSFLVKSVLEVNPYLSLRQLNAILTSTTVLSSIASRTCGIVHQEGLIQQTFASYIAMDVVGEEEVENEQQLWTVYPNPAAEQLYFTMLDELPTLVQIVSLEGTIVQKEIRFGTIQIKDLNPGVYWVRLEVNGRIQQQKFSVR